MLLELWHCNTTVGVTPQKTALLKKILQEIPMLSDESNSVPLW